MKTSSKLLVVFFIGVLLHEYVNAEEDLPPPKNSDEEEKTVGKSMMRFNKKGGAMLIKRRGRFMILKIKDVIVKYSNGTEKSKKNLKNVNFTKDIDAEDTGYGVTAAKIALGGAFGNGAKAKLEMFMFKSNGTVTGDDGNEYEVVEGATKLNIGINLVNSVEAFDVTILIGCGGKRKLKMAKKAKKAMGKKGPRSKSKGKDPTTLDVCPSGRVTFSPSYTGDGADKNMPDDYPKTEVGPRGETMVTLHFVGKNITYDPIMETGDDIEADPENVVVTTSSATKCHVTNWFTVFAAMLFLCCKYF